MVDAVHAYFDRNVDGDLKAMTVEWGSVPDWVTAGVSLLALGAAAWAAKAAAGQLAELKRESEDRAREQEQAQASAVAVWLERQDSGAFVAMIINASRLPVYEAAIGFINPNIAEPQLIRTPVLQPRSEPWELTGVSQFVNLMARRDPSIHASWFTRSESSQPLQTLVDQPDGTQRWEVTAAIGPIGLTISFTDAENRRWHRDLSGRLTRTGPDFQVVEHSVLIKPG